MADPDDVNCSGETGISQIFVKQEPEYVEMMENEPKQYTELQRGLNSDLPPNLNEYLEIGNIKTESDLPQTFPEPMIVNNSIEGNNNNSVLPVSGVNTAKKKTTIPSAIVNATLDILTSALTATGVRRDLNDVNLGYSVIEDANPERNNYISKDDLKRLEEPEVLNTLGGHPIASKDTDSENSWRDSSDFEDEVVKCKICRKEFADEEELDYHIRLPLVDKSFRCCACGKCFRDNSQLIVHGRTHTGEQPFECKECGKKFSINGNLSKHMRVHTGERRFECKVCTKKFTQFAHLEDHVKTHSGERPFQCDVCLTAFKTKARLRKHVKCHQEEGRMSKRSVRCSICDKVMKTYRQLMDHIKSHDESNVPYECLVCGKTYRTLFYLQSHQKLHNGVRAFQCSICGKAFTTSSQLRRHVHSHAGIKPFTCKMCNRSFPSTQNLKRHTLTHTGVKPYSCNVCSKGFLTLENLNRHMRIHTGEKPYTCDLCGKSFAHSTTVKEHRLTHTGDRPFGCSVCGKRFTTNKMLYKHIRQKHPDYYETFKEINEMPPNTLIRKAAIAQIQQDVLDLFPTQSTLPEQTEVTTAVKTEFPDEADRAPDTSGKAGSRNDATHLSETVEVKKEFIDLSCDICKKTFKSVGRLERHVENHSKTKSYTCDICQKKLATAESLERHVARHDKLSRKSERPRPFGCKSCDKTFISKAMLERHIKKLHNGDPELLANIEPNFSCEDRSQENIFELVKIKMEKESDFDCPYQPQIDPSNIACHPCDICFKNFVTLEELQTHKQIHTEEKPFYCDICEETFMNINSLNEHRWVHTGNEPFRCSFCNKQFVSTRLLFDHVRSDHPIQYELVKPNKSHNKGHQDHGTGFEDDQDVKPVLEPAGMSDLIPIETKVKVENMDCN